MSIAFIDGFDHYDSAAITSKWTFTSTNTSMSVGSFGRFGSKGMRFNDSQYVAKVLSPDSMFVLAFAFKAAAAADRIIAAFWDGTTTQLELRLKANGTLSITRNGTALSGGVSTATLPVGAFVYFEWKVTIGTSISAHSNVLKMSGNTVIDIDAGENTKNAGTTANAVVIGAQIGGSGYTHDYDDLYVVNGQGTVNNDFVGDRRVEVIRPASDGAHNDFDVTGAVDAHSAVNEATPDGDASYVSSNTPDALQTFGFTSLASTPDSIAAVQFGFVVRKDDAGTRLIAPCIRSGGTDHIGDSLGCPDSYSLLLSQFETNPATDAAWTASDIAGLEAGFKLVQ